MTTCTEKHHPNHVHKHGPNCGHTVVRHADHVDYLHDGHLHHVHEDHVDEHAIAVDATNPVQCSARRKRAARTSMARLAGTKRCPTAITSITWWADACIVRTAIIATTTGPWSWPKHRLLTTRLSSVMPARP